MRVPTHEPVETFEVEITPKDGEPFTVEVYLCECGEQSIGGYPAHRAHQFHMLDPLLIREGIMQTGLWLARKMPNGHGIVKHFRDNRKAWRKQAYAEV